jgi:3-deoxy-7-phosphoheptulonate synthase
MWTFAAADERLQRWRALPAAHQPDWPDRSELRRTVEELSTLPPLVFPGECEALRRQLASAAAGQAFVLHGGDCAETFASLSVEGVRDRVKTLLQMALVLTYAARVSVVKIGRMAGQYAKPRSSPVEVRDGVMLPACRGDAVNGFAFTPADRTPQPRRLVQAYHHSSVTLNLIRACAREGYADLRQLHAWNADFVAASPAGQRYEKLADQIDRALVFVTACGADPPEFHATDVYSSHEALLLDYECALVRADPPTGQLFGGSGHLLWIGERTRELGGAHADLLRHLSNPLAVKLGPTATPDDVIALARVLNPDRVPGRLTFISRMGAAQVRQALPPIVRAITAAGEPVVWVCDPMHGNTFLTRAGRKTRRFADILDEITGFFEVHRSLGTHPGGIHIEFTADEVTECLGGDRDLTEADLDQRYETTCDPRLNRSQSLELAFRVAELYQARPSEAGNTVDQTYTDSVIR